MSCGCGCSDCGDTPACGHPCPSEPRSTVFCVETAQSYAHSLGRLLIGPADKLRNLYTKFGMRPYVVRVVHTRWSAGARNLGEESIIGDPIVILPTPLVRDLSSLVNVVSPIGSDERGSLMVTEISGCYTEEQLRGFDDIDGSPVPADQSYFWEIEFIRADGIHSEKRRFNLGAAPFYRADDFSWQVTLERARPERLRSTGAPRGIREVH